jgi:hypothetical protein
MGVHMVEIMKSLLLPGKGSIKQTVLHEEWLIQ